MTTPKILAITSVKISRAGDVFMNPWVFNHHASTQCKLQQHFIPSHVHLSELIFYMNSEKVSILHVPLHEPLQRDKRAWYSYIKYRSDS